MGFWRRVLNAARLGAVIAGAQGVKIKGVPIGTIADEAEREGAHIKDSVERMRKEGKKKPAPAGSSGE